MSATREGLVFSLQETCNRLREKIPELGLAPDGEALVMTLLENASAHIQDDIKAWEALGGDPDRMLRERRAFVSSIPLRIAAAMREVASAKFLGEAFLEADEEGMQFTNWEAQAPQHWLN